LTRVILRFLVRNLDAEFFLERHHELDGIKRVGAQVVHKRSVRGDFFLVHTQLLHDNALHLVGNGHESLPLNIQTQLPTRVVPTEQPQPRR